MSAAAATERVCALCDRTFAGKAGRTLGDRPLCPSCGASLRDPVPCIACRRPTRKPGRASEHDGLVCESCRRHGTHATCRVCSRHRRIAAVGDDGRALCVGCADAVPTTHPCPDCRASVPGRGTAPCRACSLARLVEHRVTLNAELLDRPWLRALFLDFCAWEGLRRTAITLPRRIGAYGRCFATIGEGCADPAEIGQERLLALLGAEGLRRNHLVVRFLVERLSLSWDPGIAEAVLERGRIGAVLAACAGEPWVPAIQGYHDHLWRARPLQPKTVRVYLTAASALLRHARVTELAELGQAHVTGHLRRKPGHAASLARFLSYAANATGVELTLPEKRRTDPKTREKALLHDARGLLERLDRAESLAEGRAILAVVLSRLHQVPLSTVLALRALDVATVGTTVTLWPDGLAVPLALPLADAFRRWASAQGGYLFPGRSSVQPLSAEAVGYHLSKPAVIAVARAARQSG
jgi:hypothetical protein